MSEQEQGEARELERAIWMHERALSAEEARFARALARAPEGAPGALQAWLSYRMMLGALPGYPSAQRCAGIIPEPGAAPEGALWLARARASAPFRARALGLALLRNESPRLWFSAALMLIIGCLVSGAPSGAALSALGALAGGWVWAASDIGSRCARGWDSSDEDIALLHAVCCVGLPKLDALLGEALRELGVPLRLAPEVEFGKGLGARIERVSQRFCALMEAFKAIKGSPCALAPELSRALGALGALGARSAEPGRAMASREGELLAQDLEQFFSAPAPEARAARARAL